MEAKIHYPRLKRLRQQLNVRPNSSDPIESLQATKSLAVVYAYVEEFSECTQLFKIWEWQQQHDVRKIEASIVEVFSKLIHQCNTALYRTYAIKITRSILQNQSRMTAIYKNLSSGRQNTVQATLRLLTAMNHVHHSTTKELKDGFNFGLKALSKFKNQRRKESDEASKTGTLEALGKSEALTEVAPGSDQTVAQVIHEFMMALCTTPGVGICFRDTAWYPPNTLKTSTIEKSGEGAKHVFNKTLSQLLTHLRPTEHILQQRLTVSILTACPELVRLFWQKSNLQLEPRLSARWLANMTLLHKITEIPVPNLYLQHTALFASHPPPLSIIIENILPTTANRTILSKGLQHTSMLVRYFTMVQLAATFQKMEQVIAVMESAVKALSSDAGETLTSNGLIDRNDTSMNIKPSEKPAQQWAGAITLLVAELRRRVPDIQIIISLHNGIQSISLSDADEEEKTRHNLFNNGILRLIKYYQQFLPQAVNESKFDIGKVIPSDFSTMKAGTLIHLIELLLTLYDFRWSNKAQDGSSSHLLKLINLFLTTAHSQIKSLTRRLISKLLGESILFQHDPSEAMIWIDSIPASNYSGPELASDQILFLQFFDDCVARCLRTPYKYVDRSLAILKALREELRTGDVEIQGNLEKIAWSLAASQRQDFNQSFSPLIMTIIEQFQHAYTKDTSKAVARSIAAFLHRLIPELVLYQNRTSALALETLNRIQEPSTQELETIQKLKLEKRSAIRRLGALEYLAITLEVLQERPLLKSTGKKGFLKGDNASLDQLLDPNGISKFVSELQNQSAGVVAINFKRLINYVGADERLIECLMDYIQTRFPFAGSIYDFPDISSIKNLNDSYEGEQDIVYTFLRRLPFRILFNNASASMISNRFVKKLLTHNLMEAEARHYSLICGLIIRRLSSWIQVGDADESAIHTCFSLLDCLLDISKATEDVYVQLKSYLWNHYILRELYLYRLSDNLTTYGCMDVLDTRVVDLLVTSNKTETITANNKTGAIEYNASSYYVHKTVELVTHELENTKKLGPHALNSKTVRYFSKLAFMCSTSDLMILLQLLLTLHHQTVFSTTATFNALLSTILEHLTQQAGSACVIPTQSTAALLRLWREQPSDDLDRIVLDVLCGCLWPNAMAATLGSQDLSVSGVFDRALNSLERPTILSLDISLVDFILNNPNLKRYTILAILITTSRAFREQFVQSILNPTRHLTQYSGEDPGFFMVVHAYMKRVSHCVNGCYKWSSSITEQDRHSMETLRSLLLPLLIQRIANSSFNSQDTLVAAETAAVLISLTTKSNKHEISSVWTLIGEIPRVGLDSILILNSLLDSTNDLEGNQDQLDRQDKIARWFEEVAIQLIMILDKNGDVEWLEPVCDRLYDVLEKHVMIRKMTIDQKILFELVSFAIEKALDNAELVRFVASLAKHYYAETLFKHRQFSSLVMPTAPTTKHIVPENEKDRLAIIELIYTLTSLEPKACCKAGFLVTLLSAYSASTTVADQLILTILRITETQISGSISNRAPLWGSAAENTKASTALFGQGMINESLDLIDPSVMMVSVIHFPFDRELECTAPMVTKSDYCKEILKQRQAPIYDPCFILPLFGTYMAFGNLLDCRRLIERNGLGMIIVALSSIDKNMRLAAYSLLDDFYTILSNTTIREKNQLVLLLDALKNSITVREDDKVPRIPAAITSFVAHAVAIILRPDHFMYPHVNKFCLQRPTIDLEDIPMFYSLFNSSSEHHRKERVWMLRLLAASIKTPEDYKLFKRRYVLDLLEAFFNSQLGEPLSKKIVIEILFYASSLPKVSLQLITQSAFLSWIHTLAATNAMSSENEFSLVPARLLLRVIQSCPKESIRWMNGIWKNQVAGIVTTMLRLLCLAKVTSVNLAWALACLESILNIFAFLESDSDIGNLLEMTKCKFRNNGCFFNSSHATLYLHFLMACEQVLTVSEEQRAVKVSSSPMFVEHTPMRTDPLEMLYRIDPAPIQSHGRVVQLGFRLFAENPAVTNEQENIILARALCYGIEEAIEKARHLEPKEA
ncbi:hypothetical protein BX616_008676 [Lobosporangium transversale]|nr:hypothetical protein BX616_008676 [Lobosporangium transversale]